MSAMQGTSPSGEGGVGGDQLAVDVEEAVLGLLDEEELGGGELADLPADLGADAAAGAGDDDGAAAVDLSELA